MSKDVGETGNTGAWKSSKSLAVEVAQPAPKTPHRSQSQMALMAPRGRYSTKTRQPGTLRHQRPCDPCLTPSILELRLVPATPCYRAHGTTLCFHSETLLYTFFSPIS